MDQSGNSCWQLTANSGHPASTKVGAIQFLVTIYRWTS